jgi:3-methyl-2-oxobutanoate hydroxymethyltransferase
VKLEGGGKRTEMVRALVDCEIPVMGHLGLTPPKRQYHGWLQGAGPKSG